MILLVRLVVVGGILLLSLNSLSPRHQNAVTAILDFPSSGDSVIPNDSGRAAEPGADDAVEAGAEAEASRRTQILIFGGNGLLGADTTEKLLNIPNGADIYLGRELEDRFP